MREGCPVNPSKVSVEALQHLLQPPLLVIRGGGYLLGVKSPPQDTLQKKLVHPLDKICYIYYKCNMREDKRPEALSQSPSQASFVLLAQNTQFNRLEIAITEP
jgi:hypothetical protein